ncbi:MAG: flagellar hook-basal body complex protein FliE [Pseudomonadota bacterium]
MNNIDTSQLLMQLRSAAAQASSSPQGPAETPSVGGGDNFSSLLTQSLDKVNSMQQQSGELTRAFEMGEENVTLPEVMIAKNKAGLAFDATIQVRNKVVEAYQTIMRMQV